ncbi:phosphate/phosphite/phosphonate ABC transporter substrate-binding protein [Pseudomonas nunensis]|uniref:PhnD/SsuA/transferrin family substrate-binding protein n=1 Tax=Pseudomonas nunensis TaxID=2961896 RepID=A0ABY5EKF4_9PSED|nr:PhnD/SsuA/transferrin family substrate-binding protein [Pseudomonas nunensis]KOY03437.1 phosphate ABC transporter substrate-binding protein [Pseudomonas nunensis]KPN93750.1 phosphate ABC transporter substrate-binding protein [Pseudomonas nunensis]MCL5225170.1 PhnD/SsuA/transferrin family substrate-binding protein [Pseudomonas nunensis]UTO15270.1 PhnD/SsuA/transferrin family substrate-binding protein [Pseudomonas nunensis]
MTAKIAELLMYTAPEPIRQANERWLTRILERLDTTRQTAEGLSLPDLWLSPDLLLTQTCGYPLMTLLRDQVRVVGRPRYELPDSNGGNHCSLLLSRADDPRRSLPAFYNSRGVINDEGSNSGMNLLRHRLAPLHRDGQFFASVGISGAHRESLRWLREDLADLAAIDSVTFAYLARHAEKEVAGLRVVARSAFSPTLPYITVASASDEQIEQLRQVMNQTLRELPDVAEILGLQEVLPATQSDYQVVLEYQQEAETLGYGRLR